MSAVRSGSSLRSLLLTPERIPDFLIPSHSPLLALSPRSHRSSLDRSRLLSDHDDSPGGSPHQVSLSLAASPRRAPRGTATGAAEDADTDLTTRAAMSLPHVEKVTTPYGFRAVLAASPCTRPRESMFHRNKPVTGHRHRAAGSGGPPSPRPVPGLPGMKELKRPAAALKLLSPWAQRT